MNSINISKKNDLLVYIKSYINSNGYPPSLSEMCRDVGFSTKSLASRYLDLLIIDGKITKKPKTSRGIRVVETPIIEYGPLVEKPKLAIYPQDDKYHDLFNQNCGCGVKIEEMGEYIVYKHCRFNSNWIVKVLDKIGE